MLNLSEGVIEGKREQKGQLGKRMKYRLLENSVVKGNLHQSRRESLKAIRRKSEKSAGSGGRDQGKNDIRWQKSRNEVCELR